MIPLLLSFFNGSYPSIWKGKASKKYVEVKSIRATKTLFDPECMLIIAMKSIDSK